MRTYKDKEELKNEINKSFEKYISEFDNIPESLKDKRIIEVDRTPAENLAYQVGWTTLVLKWEDDEKQGIEVKTPSDMFKWNQLGELYQWFTDTYSYLSLAELKDRLKENITSIHTMIDSMSDEELFQPHMRKWADDATKTAIWEVYKFIHINTVAPFGTFRTKITLPECRDSAAFCRTPFTCRYALCMPYFHLHYRRKQRKKPYQK